VNDRKERKKQIILRQIREIDKRKIFIFRRLFAFVIDNALYIVTFSFLLMFSDMYLDMTLTDETVGFLSLAVFALYFVAMWATRDATIGKLIVGLRIVTVDGQPLTFKDALIRFIIWMPLSVPAFCWVFLDKKKQALYDKAAKTVVVTVRQRKKREL
ncbi:MAG: RDD family protein, partial [bacterium]